MIQIIALITGITFGIGLAASGMTDPAKVQGFLDVFGVWDPSLVFVMGSAVVFTLISFRFILRLKQPLFDAEFHLPVSQHIDRPLLLGGALFGIGWGLTGFCPGPAIASIAYLNSDVLIFLAAMFTGAYAMELINKRAEDNS